VIELLRQSAGRAAHHPAVVDNEQTFTYGDLTAAAESVAAFLQRRGIRRFGILDHTASTVIALLAGASITGAEACVYPPSDDAGAVEELAERFDHAVIVTTQTDLTDHVTLVDPSALLTTPGTASINPPTRRPLLVLTTGTSGTPRGALQEWDRLLRPKSGTAYSPGERWLLAYGLHQFGGLQVLIHVLAAGATLIAPAPRRPREGLAAMRGHGVTHSSATPTYWRFLIAEMRSDRGSVPELEQITLGGEAVPTALINELSSLFPEARVTQVYAATEFGAISVRDMRNGLPLSVLERPDDADIQYKIIDGELWVKSRIGMISYYGEEAGESPEWRATGDLVALEGDRILFQGRNSDVINVGGVKVHPLPIEQRISTLPGVKMARVFGRKSPVTGSIVAVEVIPDEECDLENLSGAIRACCTDLVAAARPRSIRFVDSIATAGHKIVRRSVDGE